MYAKNKISLYLPLCRPSWMIFIALILSAPMALAAQDGPPGITQPIMLPVFNPSASSCSTPSGLTRTLTYVQENEREQIRPSRSMRKPSNSPTAQSANTAPPLRELPSALTVNLRIWAGLRV